MGTKSLEPPSEHVSLLHRVSSIVASNRSLNEVLGEIVGLTVQATGCDSCLVYLIDETTQEVVLRASNIPHPSDLGILSMKIGEGVTGWVAEHKSVVTLDENASADSRFKSFPVLVEDTYQAFASVPLVSQGEILGVINVHHREKHPHTRDEVALLTFIGEQMGVAMSRASLQDENTRLAEESEEMKRQLATRKLVERAKGILQSREGLTEEEAYLRLRNESRRLRRPMKDLAEAIILAEDLSRRSSAETPA
jgi:two-component system, response regulator PdtaR